MIFPIAAAPAAVLRNGKIMRPDIKGLHHDHIDGSRAVYGVIDDLYAMAGKPFPFPDKKAWLEFFRDPQEDIVARFATVTGVLQTAESLRLLACEYGKLRAAEGYKYCEGKFAPSFHTAGGLTLRQVVDAVRAGLARAESESDIRLLPVACINRGDPPEKGLEIARLALRYDGEVALDLACDEAGNPPEKHLPAFKLTRGTKVKRDCHAGEWVAKKPAADYRARLLKNLRTAVYELRADSVGHAIPLADDPELVAYVAANGIRVTGCPLSNRYSGLIKDVRELRIGELLDRGVIYTLNPDDDLFMPAMPEVLAECDRAFHFTDGQRRRLEANVWRGAFAADVK